MRQPPRLSRDPPHNATKPVLCLNHGAGVSQHPASLGHAPDDIDHHLTVGCGLTLKGNEAFR